MLSNFSNLNAGTRPVSNYNFARRADEQQNNSPNRLKISSVSVNCRSSTVLQGLSVGTKTNRRARNVLANAQLSDQKQPQVVSIGEGLFDLIADQKGLSREEVQSWTGYPGGAPANVSCALATLGLSVMFYSSLGQDERGDELFALLSSKGVNMSAVQRRKEPTRAVYVVRDMDGDREFAGFGLPTTDYSDCFITEELLPVEAIKSADFLVTGTLGLAYPVTGNTLTKAVQVAHQSDTKVLVDVNWRPVFFLEGQKPKEMISAYVKQADLVKITDDESEWLFGINAEEALKNPQLVLNELPNAMGALVTGGEKGAAFCFKSAEGNGSVVSGYVPVFKVDVVDTTGAGDAFTGGFLSYVLAAGGLDKVVAAGKEELLAAVKYGAACGGLTTQGPGAIAPQPTFEMVQQFAQEGTLVA